jgi:hypothetical protein
MNNKTDTNIQAPITREAPSFKLQSAGVQDLELVRWRLMLCFAV